MYSSIIFKSILIGVCSASISYNPGASNDISIKGNSNGYYNGPNFEIPIIKPSSAYQLNSPANTEPCTTSDSGYQRPPTSRPTYVHTYKPKPTYIPKPKPPPVFTTTQDQGGQYPQPTQQPNPSPNPPSDNTGIDPRTKEMLCAVNAIRAQVGKKPYKVDLRLMRAAQLHSEDQAAHGVMTHTGTKIASFFDRIKAQGYNCRGGAENVAWNQQNVAEVVKSWKNSPGHYSNMVGNYDCFGWGEKKLYWTQDFASGDACECPTEIQC